MKLSLSFLFALLSLPAFADPNFTPGPGHGPHHPGGPGRQRCSLIMPGQNDASGKHCVNTNAVGVAYEGFFISDSPCYSSVDEAVRVIQSEPLCTSHAHGAYCHLLPPGQNDRGVNPRHCVNEAAWGVTYMGVFFSDSPCFSSLREAAQAMQSSPACQLPDVWGSCSLLSPGATDGSNRHCVNENAWGVLYKGVFFSDSPCFSSIEEASRAMQSSPACNL